MKLFECQHCGQPLYFENTTCESCGLRLGYLPAGKSSPHWKKATDRCARWLAQGERYRFCANAQYDVCNWLVLPISPSSFAPPAATTA